MKKIIKNLLISITIAASTNTMSSEYDAHDSESTIDHFYAWGLNKEGTKEDIKTRLPNSVVIDEGEGHIIFSIGNSEEFPVNLLLEFNDSGELSEATTLTDATPDDAADMLQDYFNAVSYIEQNYNGESETSFYSSADGKIDGESIADAIGLVPAVSEGKIIIESKIDLNKYKFELLIMPIEKVRFFNPDFKFNLKEKIIIASTIINKNLEKK